MPNQERTRIADFGRARIVDLGRQFARTEIARQLGYESEHIVLMFENGEIKHRLNKIPALATALGVDPSYLMTLGLGQFLPDKIQCTVTVDELG